MTVKDNTKAVERLVDIFINLKSSFAEEIEKLATDDWRNEASRKSIGKGRESW